jgi:tetratricopeptide (TPR) repeat protein
LGSLVDEARLLNQLGWAHYMCLGDVEAAWARHAEALVIAQEVGDRYEQMWANALLAMALMHIDKIEQGLEYARHAEALAAELDIPVLRSLMRNAHGIALRSAGEFEAALTLFHDVLGALDALTDQTSPTSRWMRAMALDGVGPCHAGLGRWREAAESHIEARLAFAVLGAGYREACSALLEGVAWRRAGQHERARECLEFALCFFDGPHYRADRERVLEEIGVDPTDDWSA